MTTERRLSASAARNAVVAGALSRRTAVRLAATGAALAVWPTVLGARRAAAAEGRLRIAAHRGGAALWPENSLLAFRNVVRLGVDLLEFDVHVTADGELVVIHDPALDRTTTGSGPVAGRTLADLASVRLKAHDGTVTDERIPTLAAVLDIAASSSVGVMPEIKLRQDRGRYEGIEDKLIGALRSRRLLDRAVVQSFSSDALREVRRRVPSLSTMMLVSGGRVRSEQAMPDDIVRWVTTVGATDLGIDYHAVDARLVAAAHQAGIRVDVWTVDGEAELRRMIDLGIEMVITNRPDTALRLLGR